MLPMYLIRKSNSYYATEKKCKKKIYTTIFYLNWIRIFFFLKISNKISFKCMETFLEEKFPFNYIKYFVSLALYHALNKWFGKKIDNINFIIYIYIVLFKINFIICSYYLHFFIAIILMFIFKCLILCSLVYFRWKKYIALKN